MFDAILYRDDNDDEDNDEEKRTMYFKILADVYR